MPKKSARSRRSATARGGASRKTSSQEHGAARAPQLRASECHVHRLPATGPLLLHIPATRLIAVAPALADHPTDKLQDSRNAGRAATADLRRTDWVPFRSASALEEVVLSLPEKHRVFVPQALQDQLGAPRIEAVEIEPRVVAPGGSVRSRVAVRARRPLAMVTMYDSGGGVRTLDAASATESDWPQTV
ncbi:MAG: hypothetical protein JSV65_15550 [Armatimonadota bacterium]|nr:MAG: hypothetical protein JSV65_15550 [Armatimonadota bacterium]